MIRDGFGHVQLDAVIATPCHRSVERTGRLGCGVVRDLVLEPSVGRRLHIVHTNRHGLVIRHRESERRLDDLCVADDGQVEPEQSRVAVYGAHDDGRVGAIVRVGIEPRDSDVVQWSETERLIIQLRVVRGSLRRRRRLVLVLVVLTFRVIGRKCARGRGAIVDRSGRGLAGNRRKRWFVCDWIICVR